MASVTNKKLKVAWLCHFANQTMIRKFGASGIQEFSPHIHQFIHHFEGEKLIELHIVAPNVFNNTDTDFELNGIYYHLFSFRSSFIPLKIHRKFKPDYITNFIRNKRKIKRIINKINPGLIHLHGAEIPYYSSGILQFLHKRPVLVTIQGFIKHASVSKNKNFNLSKIRTNFIINKSINIEHQILTKFKNFGVRTDSMIAEILKVNPEASFHWHYYPITYPQVMKNYNHTGEDEFDCVFFGRLSKDKGIEDFIRAIAKIKKQRETVKALIIGKTRPRSLKQLKDLCNELSILDNVTFKGFFDTQEELYSQVIKAKVYVLPTYHDIIPGTVIESMFMKLPVVAYHVGALPDINKSQNENIILVKKFDIDSLAFEINELLNHPDKRRALAEKGYHFIKEFMKEKCDYVKIIRELKDIYQKISSGAV